MTSECRPPCFPKTMYENKSYIEVSYYDYPISKKVRRSIYHVAVPAVPVDQWHSSSNVESINGDTCTTALMWAVSDTLISSAAAVRAPVVLYETHTVRVNNDSVKILCFPFLHEGNYQRTIYQWQHLYSSINASRVKYISLLCSISTSTRCAVRVHTFSVKILCSPFCTEAITHDFRSDAGKH